MAGGAQTIQMYRELGEAYARRGEAQMCDRFLVLAADAALTAGLPDEAERLRADLLRHNPHHLLKPFPSFAEAMKTRDIFNYVGALRRSHPPEKAEQLLASLPSEPPRPPPATPRPTPRPAEPALKVLRFAPDGGERTPATVAGRPTSPPAPTEPRMIVPLAAPPPRPNPRPADAFHPPPRTRRPEARLLPSAPTLPDDEEDAGAWVSTGLGLLAAIAGVAMVGYVLVRPFLHAPPGP